MMVRRTSGVVSLLLVIACVPSGSSPPTTSQLATTTTTSITTAPVDTTSSTTTTVVPEPEIAWTEAEAERHVENYLAALEAGAFVQAGFSAAHAGIVAYDQTPDESAAEYLTRKCAGGVCQGPYRVKADGPGLIDRATGWARSVVTISAQKAGEEVQFELATFEGELFILDLPPLVAGDGAEPLIESVFGANPPGRVVVQRFEAFEIWEGATPTWVTHWHADRALQVEGDFVAVAPTQVLESGAVSLDDPTKFYPIECPRLMSRNDEVLALDQCTSDGWTLVEVISGEARDAPIPYQALQDGEYLWFTERGGTLVTGRGDAEGNLFELTNADGTDLLADGYASLAVLSTDGSYLAYVDHADPAAESHFWSPVVVVVDTRTGLEVGRWTLDKPVLCLEFAANWLVACEVDDSMSTEPDQQALIAIEVESGEVNRVETRTRVFLPVP
jgi:hypothetical protein